MNDTQKIVIAVAAPIVAKLIIFKMIRLYAAKAAREQGMTLEEFSTQFRPK